MKRGAIRAGATLVLLLTACRMEHRSVVADVDPEAWTEAAEIVLPNDDTLARCDLSLFLRCDPRFREDTLTLRVETFSPDRLRTREYHRIAPGTTRTAASVQRVVELPYRRDVRLQAAGDYYFVLTPVRPVEGVEAAGIRILTNR